MLWSGPRLVYAGATLLGGALLVGGAVASSSAFTEWIGSWLAVGLSALAAIILHVSAFRARVPGPPDPAEDEARAYSSALHRFGWAAVAWCMSLGLRAVTTLDNLGLSPVLGDALALTAVVCFALGFTRLAPFPGHARSIARGVVDAYVVAVSLFALCWLLLLSGVYPSPATSVILGGMALIRVIVGLFVLGLIVPLVLTSPFRYRRLAAVAAIVFSGMTVADVLSATSRLAGEPIVGGADSALRVAVLFLAVGLPFMLWTTRAPAPRRITGWGLYRFAPDLFAILTTAVTLLAWMVAAIHLHGLVIGPVLTWIAGSGVLAVLLRLLGGLDENTRLSRLAHDRERHLHTLARHNGDAVLVVDDSGCIEEVTPGTAQAYGYTQEALLGTSLMALIHPEDRPRLREAAVTLRKSPEVDVRVQMRVRAEDGTWRHTESTASPYNTYGAHVRFLVTARDVSAQVALQAQVNHLTFHDSTTGLPNRAYLEERTRELIAQRDDSTDGVAAVIFLDLDAFTAVNDSAGHRFGDYLLAQAARRMRSAVGQGDTVVRWGGDEFAVLVEHDDGARHVVDLANRILRAISGQPFAVGEREVQLTASLGVAFAEPDMGGSELLRNADMAMARAKELGAGGHVEVYAADMHTAAVRRVELQAELRQALADEEFTLVYQPVVNLETSRVVAVEALVRWRRGETLVGPEEFLSAAEESGLVVGLGNWILRTASTAVAQWRRDDADLGLAVNLSPAQAKDPDFVGDVSDALAASGLPPDALTLEVGEEILLEEGSGVALGHLAELRELGVRVAIDDFGTGYASLSQLRPLAVDALKIDPSFVTGLGEDSTLTLLTSTIVSLGRDLGVQVIAEGIERPAQRDQLRSMGCGFGQGFCVGHPVPEEELAMMLGGWEPAAR
ncbi:EAL domain-containing protein [Spiractinospora alimapuensis]|nr:EAL domain-containing protein [Spiractinospora alimapuensis]